mgnify:FL=1
MLANMKSKCILSVSICVVTALLPVGCGNSQAYVPSAPDYNDDEMWVRRLNDHSGQGADVFYIPSTWEFDWKTPDGAVSHFADVHNPRHRADMATEINIVAEYMAPDNNFYSPYYRHITLDSWATLNEDTINRRYHDVAFADVKAAFDHYLSHDNDGRPFILAGFSQGAKSVVELMKAYPEEVKDRMIAAYVLGYKVTPEDAAKAPWITPAHDSIDTGVTICYNSVSDVKYVKPIISTPNVMCINPVNWTTDSLPATLNDSITVMLAPTYNVLVVSGFDGSKLPNILDILNTGDYHGAEAWLYSDCLRKNIRQRTKSYRSSVN